MHNPENLVLVHGRCERKCAATLDELQRGADFADHLTDPLASPVKSVHTLNGRNGLSPVKQNGGLVAQKTNSAVLHQNVAALPADFADFRQVSLDSCHVRANTLNFCFCS